MCERLSVVFSFISFFFNYHSIAKIALNYDKINLSGMYYIYSIATTAAVAQWVRAYSPQVEDWVFEYKPRQIKVVKTGSDSSTAKRSALGASVTGPR